MPFTFASSLLSESLEQARLGSSRLPTISFSGIQNESIVSLLLPRNRATSKISNNKPSSLSNTAVVSHFSKSLLYSNLGGIAPEINQKHTTIYASE